MPISIKRDVKPAYGLGDRFSLRDTPLFVPLGPGGEPTLFGDIGGFYMHAVRPRIADENWYEFYRRWEAGPNVGREISKLLASKFHLNGQDATFDQLWHLIREARGYYKQQRDAVHDDIERAYEHAARIAGGDDIDEPTFGRLTVRGDARLVIFSDHHLTAYATRPNYFKDFNRELYLDVLSHYAQTDFCLVENGDVEECIIYEPDLASSTARKQAAPAGDGIDEIVFPVSLTGGGWDDFLDLRYDQRERTLEGVIDEFQDYYDLLRDGFIARGKYVRLTGNHDTYLAEDRERVLRDRIEGELGIEVRDVLRVERGDRVDYVVMHGHQFDPVCIQHGTVPYAKSLGEMFSECLGWSYEGPDRAWTLSDTKRWYIGTSYQNILAREEHGTFKEGKEGWWDLITSDQWDLLAGNIDDIKSDSKDFVETLMGAEIAWEYFENADGFHALTLEVWAGDEWFKMKHMNEVELCKRYVSEFLSLQDPPDFSIPVPKLIVGHTHEPRQNAVFPTDPGEQEPWEQTDTGAGAFYLNSGSAGRYQNLVWCVEIEGTEDRICSWSRVDGRLKKITWRSDGDRLLHDDPVDWIDP